jgi:hypothetical protein
MRHFEGMMDAVILRTGDQPPQWAKAQPHVGVDEIDPGERDQRQNSNRHLKGLKLI